MKKQIWKYPFEVSGRFSILIPKDAQILSVQTQNETPCIWALVNIEAKDEERDFTIIGTGHPVEVLPEMKFIGTFQLEGGTFVGHLFEYN